MRIRTPGALRHRGFTLIELMITAAIIVLLVAVALPSYTRYAVRGSREAAKTELEQLAALQEKIYLNSSAYAASITADYNGRSDGGLGVPTAKTQDSLYTLSVAPSTPAQTFTLTATPVTGSRQASDGTITLTSTGVRLRGGAPW